MIKIQNNEPKVLIYDIETTPLLTEVFRLGKQVLRHTQLLGGYFSRTHIISISYTWAGTKKVYNLNWGNSLEDEESMIREFSKVLEEADIVIGKNNQRFDDKHIMTQQMWYGHDSMTDLLDKSEDLEKQIRRYFALPSYSLDYITQQLGSGSKDHMDFADWHYCLAGRLLNLMPFHLEDLEELCLILFGEGSTVVNNKSKAAFNKMCKYNSKDVIITANSWEYLKKYFKLKHNYNKGAAALACPECGSKNIVKNGTILTATSVKQRWKCLDHNGHAGYTVISDKPQRLSKAKR